MKRHIAKNSDQKLPINYSPAVKSFSLTLNFYSPRAYNFVRTSFDTSLPHPQFLEILYGKVEVKPGWTEASFTALRGIYESQNNANVYSLIMDEIAIRQHVEWDGKKYHGFIDMGTQMMTVCQLPKKH